MGKFVRYILILCLLISLQDVTAQDGRDTVQIFFPQDEIVLREDYMGNKEALDAFRERIVELYATPGHRPYKVSIISGASPEGPIDRNDWLSRSRAEVIRQYLIEHTPQLPPDMFVIRSAGEDWGRLLQMVEERDDVPNREQVIDVLKNTPVWIRKDGKVVDGKKRQLQNVGGGRAWNWMLVNIYPKLRQSTAQVDYRIEELPGYIPEPEPIVEPEPEPVFVPVPEPEYRVDTVYVFQRDTVYLRDTVWLYRPCPTRFAIKTNTLYDAALVPNIGVEFILGEQWSLSANWMYSWWHNDNWHWYWRTYGGDIAIRRWWGGKGERYLTGHHLGLYAQMVTYDFELGKRGYLGDRWTWAGGVEYGYAMPVGKKLNLDFTIGVGYMQGEYKEYLPIQGCYVWQATKMRRWLGPTKLEVSLVYMVGDPKKYKKGGMRRWTGE